MLGYILQISYFLSLRRSVTNLIFWILKPHSTLALVILISAIYHPILLLINVRQLEDFIDFLS